jgi:hypothetical protein
MKGLKEPLLDCSLPVVLSQVSDCASIVEAGRGKSVDQDYCLVPLALKGKT